MTEESETTVAGALSNKKPSTPQEQQELLELYKLYAASMESLVARRVTTHGVFLTANAFLISAGGLMLNGLENPDPIVRFLLMATLATTGVFVNLLWRRLSRHYGLLNGAKFSVLHAMETNLVAAAFSAEWVALGRGTDPKRYQSMATTESLIPFLLAVLYVVMACMSWLPRSVPPKAPEKGCCCSGSVSPSSAPPPLSG